MNPGEMNERISVLRLNQAENSHSWATVSTIWAKAEQISGNNLFSRVGLGAKTVKFTIRARQDLTLHDAFRWNEKHCFLTDIVRVDRMYYEVMTALVEPVICTVTRTGEPTRDNLNRPVLGVSEVITFPACITEKYIGYTQGEPMGVKEIRYVLITPKIILLQVGELVTANESIYEVTIPHILDEYKNEYEIVRKEDA